MCYHISIGSHSSASNLDFNEEDLEEFHILKDEMKKLFSKYMKWERISISVDGKKEKFKE